MLVSDLIDKNDIDQALEVITKEVPVFPPPSIETVKLQETISSIDKLVN